MKVNAPEKIYIDGYSSFACEANDGSIEYTRVDAFIEKACEFLNKNADNCIWYDEIEHECGMTDDFIEDFKNYMKGE